MRALKRSPFKATFKSQIGITDDVSQSMNHKELWSCRHSGQSCSKQV